MTFTDSQMDSQNLGIISGNKSFKILNKVIKKCHFQKKFYYTETCTEKLKIIFFKGSVIFDIKVRLDSLKVNESGMKKIFI